MAFNREAAKAAGYTDEEIDAYLASLTASNTAMSPDPLKTGTTDIEALREEASMPITARTGAELAGGIAGGAVAGRLGPGAGKGGATGGQGVGRGGPVGAGRGVMWV